MFIKIVLFIISVDWRYYYEIACTLTLICTMPYFLLIYDIIDQQYKEFYVIPFEQLSNWMGGLLIKG